MNSQLILLMHLKVFEWSNEREIQIKLEFVYYFIKTRFVFTSPAAILLTTAWGNFVIALGFKFEFIL